MHSSKKANLKTDNLSTQVYQHFRSVLMEGHYKPGQKIKLKDVSEELGISATPVREALGRLVSEQILSQADRRSVNVPILRRNQFKEIRDLRCLLEGEAAAKASQLATQADVKRLAAIHERMCQARDVNDAYMPMKENLLFHRAVCNLANMPMLTRFVGNLWLQIGPLMNAFINYEIPPPRQTHWHLDVLQGLESADDNLAKNAIQQDIMVGSDRLLAYLEEQREALEK